MSYAQLKAKFSEKRAKICVIGLGYVGLPLAVEFAKGGFYVTGIDTDTGRVRNVRESIAYILDVPIKEISAVVKSGRLYPTHRFEALKSADAVIICVPTPLKRRNQPNISYIIRAVKEIAKYLHKDELVVLESTTYPGTTDEVILPLLEKSGLSAGRDFYLAFSPERIDPGNEKYPFKKIPKVVGGITQEATDLVKALYEKVIVRVVPVSSARVAETVKLLENTFRLINIGLVNELSMMAHKMGIDIWEVITAAATKPFGFMPFYPGPGVGGHCLDKKEALFVKDKGLLKAMQMPEFINYIQETKNNKVEVLSFDPLKKKSVFRRVTAASARPYSGKMVEVITEDGRRLKVTDLHPMFIYDSSRWRLKYAKDLLPGDCLPVPLGLPAFNKEHRKEDEVDLLDEIKSKGRYLIASIRIKPLGFSWKDYKKEIKTVLLGEFNNKLPDIYWDYLSDKYLPLRYFYALEELCSISHRRLKLVTGRGPSYSEMPARIVLNADFCRLLGYYLSEGCYTKDKSARIRFSFNRSEKEYIEDVVGVLRSLGIRSSIYESKKWHTSCIKVSSNLFGFLIYEALGCGNNCYNMNIPAMIFSVGIEKKRAILSGILRGDGCVEHFFGKWHYRKNEKEYFHNVNTANISYFTSSQKLFQQVIILLQSLNIVPTFRKRKYSLSIFGYKQLSYCKDLFLGKKKEVIEKYLQLNKNRPRNKTFRKIGHFATVKVKSTVLSKGDWVYSLETEKPHAFVTSYGIAVHNCIPKDPLYLYWKAKHHGFTSKFIKLASQINSRMPEYIVARAKEILAKRSISFAKSRILVLGATYKKDVKDLRKSPAIEIIDLLLKEVRGVSYSDPLIPYLKFNSIDLKSKPINQATLAGSDCVIIATDHSEFDYDLIKKYSKLILDTRNIYKGVTNENIFRL